MNTYLQTPLAHFLAIWLAIGPAFDIYISLRLKENCDSTLRIRIYAWVVCLQWMTAALAVVCVGVGPILSAGSAVADAHATLGTPLGMVMTSALALALLRLVVRPFLKRRNPKVIEAYKRATEASRGSFMLPASVAELRWFTAISITAGVCEEILFRSFLILYLHEGWLRLPLPLAFAAATIMFGVNHAYQGVAGIVQTGIIGTILGLLFLSTGSLWIVMVIHAVIDLQVVLMLRPLILSQNSPGIPAESSSA